MLVETNPYVPYDMYESEQEIVIIMPLWWVNKDSLNLKIEDYKLLIQWKKGINRVKRFFNSNKGRMLLVKSWTKNRFATTNIFW